MCLGIPGKVIEVRDDAALLMGKVDFGGVRKEVCLAYTPEVRLGDYVIVHVGFAISRVDEEEALRRWRSSSRWAAWSPPSWRPWVQGWTAPRRSATTAPRRPSARRPHRRAPPRPLQGARREVPRRVPRPRAGQGDP